MNSLVLILFYFFVLILKSLRLAFFQGNVWYSGGKIKALLFNKVQRLPRAFRLQNVWNIYNSSFFDIKKSLVYVRLKKVSLHCLDRIHLSYKLFYFSFYYMKYLHLVFFRWKKKYVSVRKCRFHFLKKFSVNQALFI